MTVSCLPPLKDCTVSSIRTSTQVEGTLWASVSSAIGTYLPLHGGNPRVIAMGSLLCPGVYWTDLANSGLFLPSIGVLSSISEGSVVSPGKKTAR